MSRRERVLGLLQSLEWAGDIHGDAACPSCFAPKDVDLPANPEKGYDFEPAGVHKPGCELMALVSELSDTSHLVFGDPLR